MNIYVPDEVKNDLSLLDLKGSQLAVAAFKEAIAQARSQHMAISVEPLQRLRGQRETVAKKRRADGIVKGKAWAVHENISYEQVERVASLVLEDEIAGSDNIVVAARFALTQAIEGSDSNVSQKDIDIEMEMNFGGTKPSYDEIEGFIEGVTEVFDQI